MTFLVTEYGRPFTAAGFGGWFRKRCDEAGLPKECTFHGLRKAACTRLAEAGCSANVIASISGHATLREVERYTKAANQRHLATIGMDMMRTGSVNADVSLPIRGKSRELSTAHRRAGRSGGDSNPQPPVLETGALAIELHSYIKDLAVAGPLMLPSLLSVI